MALFVAGLALTAAGTVFQMMQQRRQTAYAAEMQRTDAEAQANAARFNAEVSRMNADELARVAFENRRLGRRQISRNTGLLAARTAARGASVTSATAEDIQYEMALRSEFQLQEQFRAQFAEAIGASSRATMQETMGRFATDRGVAQADITRSEGRQMYAATALTGATNVAMMTANWNMRNNATTTQPTTFQPTAGSTTLGPSRSVERVGAFA